MPKKPSKPRAKRNAGEGTIFEKGGKVIIRTMVGYLPNGKPRVMQVSGATLREAQAKQRALQMRYAKGELTSTGRIVFAEWLRDFIDERKVGVTANTHLKHLTYLRLVEKNPLANMLLTDIRVSHLERFYQSLAQTHSKSTVTHVRHIVTRALQKAARYEMIPSNPAANAEMPRMTTTEVSRALTESDVNKLLTINAGHRQVRLWATIIALGLRHDEALSLTWAMLDTDDAGAPLLHVPGTKTKNALRDVYLPPILLPLLDEQRRVNALDAQTTDGYHKNDLIFPSSVGTKLSQNNVRRAYRTGLRAAGIDPTYRIHDLRATHITHQIAHNVDPKTVAANVGHSDPRTTLKTYTHLVVSNARKAALGAGLRLPALEAPAPEVSPYMAALEDALAFAKQGQTFRASDVREAHPQHSAENIGAALASKYFDTISGGGRGKRNTYRINKKGLAKKADLERKNAD